MILNNIVKPRPGSVTINKKYPVNSAGEVVRSTSQVRELMKFKDYNEGFLNSAKAKYGDRDFLPEELEQLPGYDEYALNNKYLAIDDLNAGKGIDVKGSDEYGQGENVKFGEQVVGPKTKELSKPLVFKDKKGGIMYKPKGYKGY